ncbi:MAG: GNAT family N-acetyltransferase [Anaerolineae bacterium]|nr:GNAT family N-acetyltransferase [Anaerolineae bacterium]
MIQSLEETALNTWPALKTILYDGWVIRFAGGYTRRSNSVSPLYGSSLDLDHKIAYCEALYTSLGLPTVFKLTDAACPPDLDSRLARSGYVENSRTSVQLLDLTPDHAVAMPDVDLTPSLSPTWIGTFCRLTTLNLAAIPTMTAIHNNIVTDHVYAALTDGDEITAVGMAAADRDMIGIYDIVTDPAKRRRGFATRIMLALLAWGKSTGASRAWLSVMCNNPAALNCYEKLGFQEVYQYWYRVRR